MTWTKKDREDLKTAEGQAKALKDKRVTELKPVQNFINQNNLANLDTEDLAGALVDNADRLTMLLAPYTDAEQQADDPRPAPTKPDPSANLTTGIQSGGVKLPSGQPVKPVGSKE